MSWYEGWARELMNAWSKDGSLPTWRESGNLRDRARELREGK